MGSQALPVPFLNPNWSHYFMSTEDGAPNFPPGWFSSKPVSFEVRPPCCNLPHSTLYTFPTLPHQAQGQENPACCL